MRNEQTGSKMEQEEKTEEIETKIFFSNEDVVMRESR
jgi:hypothetical protein